MTQLESIAPSDGRSLGSVTVTAPEQIAELVALARGACREWSAIGPAQRAMRVAELGRVVSDHAGDLAHALALEVGKPIAEARAEVARTAQICAYYGGVGYELGGIVRRSADPRTMILSRQAPVGVAGVITPWNFPLAIPAWKLVPALVAGCPVVWKPASASVLTGERFVQLAHAAGIPEHVLTIVFGGSELGTALAESDLDALSFTGSSEVGGRLRELLGGRRRPRLTLELGGVNVSHVLSDADLDAAARDIVAAAFGYAGQKCTATQVIAADRSIARELRDRLASEIGALKVGDPLVEDVVVGPVIAPEVARQLRERIDRIARDHELICAAPAPDGESFVAPTLFADGGPASELIRAELFGPIAVLVETSGIDDHVRVASASGMGLSAAVYATRSASVRRLLNRVDAGVVAVNRPSTGLDPHVPFGGWADSGGHFSEQGLEGLRFYLKWQTVYWRDDGDGVEFP
jgi:acyl-CoA reductase-like NAD-dependent aldehyde dehydrogenase